MSTYEEIMSAALALPPDARAMLAEHLIESLESEDQQRIDALWAEEAARRDQEIENGIGRRHSRRRGDEPIAIKI